ncbi:MAG TPA: FAD-binding oxidoreductase, partial [Caldilineae bacterium]|nr:FAD-binding oxidoreductase [Caldilineae bacterium]
VPASALPAHPLVNTEPDQRLRHARGQSLPDWVALRFGEIERFPDGVAYPTSEDEVAQIIAYGQEIGAGIIPYGGGSSVVGHINPTIGDQPILTVDMSRLSRLQELDETDRLATFGAGVSGPHIEAQLRAQGYTLGHFPQSFEYSTLGGWIATRSSGQQSIFYGRIEDLFAGGRLISPAGKLDLPPFPASAAGPDLRQLLLGSEGRLGVITTATVRIRPLPEQEDFHAAFFPDWPRAVVAVREIVQAGIPISMLRLSDAEETETTLILAGRGRLLRIAERGLRARGLREGKCLLLFGVTGNSKQVKQARNETLDVVGAHNGVHVGRIMGNEWRKNRFRTPYLRNTLWEAGYAIDTLETAVPWSAIHVTKNAILQVLRQGLEAQNERVHAFGHLSHLYPTGAGIYITLIFRIAPSAAETLARWRILKQAASEVIVEHGGTISHQHGVGVDHAPYLAAEKGELGLQALADVASRFDPDGMMNPGKLLLS